MSKMKITPVAYDNESTYREDMISDTVFTASTPFLIISSQPIPKDTNMYFEFEITDYKENPLFRHLPLYVGIHKEPSSGIFATDFSLGSIILEDKILKLMSNIINPLIVLITKYQQLNLEFLSKEQLLALVWMLLETRLQYILMANRSIHLDQENLI